MLPPIKLVKIALPVATVTTATIATVSLVSSKKEDEKLDNSKEDTVLKDFDKSVVEFEEQIMLYSEDGTQESKTISREELEKLSNSAPGGETKGPNSLNDAGEPIKGTAEDSEPEGSQSQVPLSDVNGFLGNESKSDKKDIVGAPEDDVDLSKSAENVPIDEAEDNNPHDSQKLDMQKDEPSEDPNVNRESSEVDSKKNGESGEENQETLKSSVKTEPEQQPQTPIDSNEEGAKNEKDHDSVQEPTLSGDNSSIQDDNVTEENTGLQKADREGQEATSFGSSSDLQSPSNKESIDGGGETSSVPVSSGQDNGVAGEHGQEPMTPEQLQRIATMGQEVEEVLGILGSLFKVET